ncbi:MAG: 3-deoxy-7-phosphoheptulonate synthase, partial [Oscillospiraceae bacterium]|nr:3-deoxy-7-phosphoheptulonate synthase [Oscillospiraceae bacterium]
AALKGLTHLPVITDPSHATGRVELLEPMCLCSIMAGCDGLMLEVHNAPNEALSDGEQSLTPEQFSELVKSVNKVREAII